MEFIYYKLVSDMRWDQLAYYGYGDATRMADLLDANQQIGVYNWVPKDSWVKFPIILEAALNPLLANLPAWKQ